MNYDPTQKSILATLAYRDVFSYPLTYYQLYSYLISDSESIAKEDFDVALQRLMQNKVIAKDEAFYFLPSLEKHKRLERSKNVKALYRRAKRIGKVLSFIPLVKFVGITGAVAAGNAKKDDDIDVLIITSAGKLWTTRFFTVLLLKVLRLYRKDSNERAKVCPNIFIDESKLTWEGAKNVYTAHEVFLMQSIYDKKDFYFKFLQANKWANGFLPNLKSSFDIKNKASKTQACKSGFGERVFMTLQLWYMKSKKTREITTDRLIHFKRDDHLDSITQAFAEKIKELNIG